MTAVFYLLLATVPSAVAFCGTPGSIWGKEMGDTGACQPCIPDPDNPPLMLPEDKDHWTCSATGDISLDLSGMQDVRKCMSFSTEGYCEFRQRDLLTLQVTLESSGCNGLWVAPIWIAPQTWAAPQRDTGEVDIFERGCYSNDGYLLSLGSHTSHVWQDAWQEKHQPEANTSLTAFLEFDRNDDKLTVYRCPLGANPITDGTASCTQTRSGDGYFSQTAMQTQNGEEYMHFVSDLWNGCTSLCSKMLGPQSGCNFKVSNLKLRLAGPFRDGAAAACQSLLVSEPEEVAV